MKTKEIQNKTGALMMKGKAGLLFPRRKDSVRTSGLPNSAHLLRKIENTVL